MPALRGCVNSSPGRTIDADRMCDARAEDRHGVRQRAVSAADVERKAAAFLRTEPARDHEPAEPGRLRFLGEWRRRKEAGPDREPAAPAPGAKQRGHARTEERAVLAVMIEAAAAAEREPLRQLDIGLAEDARCEKCVRELRHVAWTIGIALHRDARDKRVPARRWPEASPRQTPCRAGRARGCRQTGGRDAVARPRRATLSRTRSRKSIWPTRAAVDAARVQRLLVRRPVAGSVASSIVPPLRFSAVNPTVAKNDRPLPSSQNTRGRTTPRE